MARLEARPQLTMEVVLRLTESEARFLEGMSGFDPDVVLKAIRSVCGTSYTEGNAPEAGVFHSLMAACRRELPEPLRIMKVTREAFVQLQYKINDNVGKLKA